MNIYLKKILWPLVLVRRIHDNYLRKHNPERLFSLFHKRVTGYGLNINNPQSFNEKIAYLAFRTDTTEWSKLADKVGVRAYVEECGYKEFLPILYGTYKSSDEINYNDLPNSFVIKTNHGSATNIIIKDKSTVNQFEVNQKLDEWLKTDYGYKTCQPHYSRIEPLILAEELLKDNDPNNMNKMLIDYKFYCINGEPTYVLVLSDRIPNTHQVKQMFFDIEWNMHPEFNSGIHPIIDRNIQKPTSFEKMKEISRVLSGNFPFVRIDFYEINGVPKFGEMTFTPGFDTMSAYFLNILGEKVKI